MFVLASITAISLIAMVWFRSFEEDLFVLLNPEAEKQAEFYADRGNRTPTIYANITEVLVNARATIYDAMGFLEGYNSKEVDVQEEYEGEVNKLPLSGDR